QDDWELGLTAGAGQAVEFPVLAECDAVEELEGTEGLVVGAGGGVLAVVEVEQVGSDLGGPQEFGRLAEVPGEAGDALDVGFDGVGLEVTEGHVVDPALAQGRHGELLSPRCGMGNHLMMAQATGERGAVVRGSKWWVIGWRPADRNADLEYQHRPAIETSPAKRVSSMSNNS